MVIAPRLHSGIAQKDGGKGKSSKWQNFEQCIWLFILSGKRDGGGIDMHWLIGYCWMARNLNGTQSENWGGRGLRKRYENRPLQMDIQCEDIYIPCECIPKGDFSKENFNNQVDKMTIKYRCQLASFLRHPCYCQQFHEQNSKDESFTQAQQGLSLTRANLATAFPEYVTYQQQKPWYSSSGGAVSPWHKVDIKLLP